MLGIIDWAYARKKRNITHEDVDWKPKIERGTLYNDSWYCFVPKIVTRNQTIGEGILPKDGKATIYTLSTLNIIRPDVDETLENLREIYRDALSRMNQDLLQGKRISLLGVSLGNVIAIKLASELLKGRLRNLVSLVGSTRLGFSAWRSNLTGQIVKQSGLASALEYEARVSEFSPIHYLPCLTPRMVFARFGVHDLAIPYNPEGEELKRALKNLEATGKDIKAYHFADHCSAIFFSSKAHIYEKLR